MQRKIKGELPQQGEVYGSLTLTGVSFFRQEKGGRRLRVEAQCVCGDIRDYAYRYLKNGNTKSCGCVRNKKLAEANATHHLTSHPLYQVYMDMKVRCYSPACKSYENYGGRGIRICQEWLDDINAFRIWGMENGYAKGLQLDREDNNGDYTPSNCRWVTKDVNNVNTRRNIYMEAWGERKTVTDWSRDKRCKVNWNTLKGRLRTGKWDLIDAMTTKASGKHKEIQRNSGSARQLTIWGETKSLIEWSEDKRCQVGYSGFKGRLRKGWTPEQAMTIPR